MVHYSYVIIIKFGDEKEKTASANSVWFVIFVALANKSVLQSPSQNIMKDYKAA